MDKVDSKLWMVVRKCIFLALFIVGCILVFNTTESIVNTIGFDNLTGVSRATDKRSVYILVSLFGLVGSFVEVILERISKF